MKPGPSDKLLDIGICLVKFISSRRDITCVEWPSFLFAARTHKHANGEVSEGRHDNFDEFTQRQYMRRAPHLPNPFGDGGEYEEPRKFSEFDVFQKLRVLHQLTVWTFANPDNIRKKMPDLKEIEQTEWVCGNFFSSSLLNC